MRSTRIILFLLNTLISSCLFSQINSVGICDYYQTTLPYQSNCNNWDYYLAFEDEFNSNSLNTEKWTLPNYGVVRGHPTFDQEKQWYMCKNESQLPVSNNVLINNGKLQLVAREEPTPIIRDYYYWLSPLDEGITSSNFKYTSGQITSNKYFHYGAYEIRCKIPKGKGFWPAFWGFGWFNGVKGEYNELDVFEFTNQYTNGVFDLNKSTSSMVMTTHYDWLNAGINFVCSDTYLGNDFSQSYYSYKVEWTEYYIRWYIRQNDNQPYTYVGGRAKYNLKWVNSGGTYYQPMTCGGINTLPSGFPVYHNKSFPEKPLKIIANLAIHNNLYEPDNNTPFPSSLDIDYIRYYKKYPCVTTNYVTQKSDIDYIWNNFNYVQGDPVTLNGSIEVLPWQQLKLVGKDEVNIYPGFDAKIYSDFEARVNPGVCSINPMRLSNESYDEYDQRLNRYIDSDRDSDITNNESPLLILYPNPVVKNSDLFIVLNTDETVDIRIYSLSGTLVDSRIETDVKKHVFDLSTSSSGIYIVKVTGKNINISEKVQLLNGN